MVLNTQVVVRVARVSAQTWQWLSCIHDPINSDQLLDLLFCFPLHQLGRLTLCLCSFFCLPQPYSFYSSYLLSDSEFDSDSDDASGSSTSTLHLEHDYYYHSHSDCAIPTIFLIFSLVTVGNFDSLLAAYLSVAIIPTSKQQFSQCLYITRVSL